MNRLPIWPLNFAWSPQFVLITLCGFMFGCGSKPEPPATPTRPHLHIAVIDGGVEGAISGPLFAFKGKWETDNNADLTIVSMAGIEAYEQWVLSEAREAESELDGVIAPASMMGDFIAGDHIVAVDPFLKKPGFPQWEKESVVPPVAKLLQWEDTWYACPYDGDAYLLFYREDILNDAEYKQRFEEKTGKPLTLPPRTWEEVAEIAEYFKAVDWNKNGAADDHGFSFHFKPGSQAYWQYLALSAPYVVNRGNEVTRFQNVYAFDPENMEPLLENAGHERALDMLRRLVKTGDKAQLGWGAEDAQSQFLAGKSLFCLTTGNLARLAQDTAKSTVQKKLGICTPPGTLFVWNRKNQDWTELSRPNLIGNTCGANWQAALLKKSINQDLAYSLFALHANRLTNMANITNNRSGIDPSRQFQFLETKGGQAKLDDYTKAGFDPHDAEEYLSGFHENCFATATMLAHLRIPGTPLLMSALDEEIARTVADDSVSSQAALRACAEKWKTIVSQTDTQLGAGKLLTLYRQSIGYKTADSKD